MDQLGGDHGHVLLDRVESRVLLLDEGALLLERGEFVGGELDFFVGLGRVLALRRDDVEDEVGRVRLGWALMCVGEIAGVAMVVIIVKVSHNHKHTRTYAPSSHPQHTLESGITEKVQNHFRSTIVNDTSRLEQDQVVKHLKNLGLWLMDRGDDGGLPRVRQVA